MAPRACCSWKALLLLLVLLLDSSNRAWSKPQGFTSTPYIRQAASFHTIEHNPDYVPHPSSPVTLGDLENDKSQIYLGSSANYVDTSERLSLPQLIYRSARSMYERSPEVFWTSTVSVVFFVLWQVNPSLCQKHLVSSRRNLSKGRIWSILLSSVSHTGVWHLVMNLVSFSALGPRVLSILPNRQSFRMLLLGSAVAGSALQLLLTPNPSLGLSGVVMGCMSVFAREMPDAVLRFFLMGMIPVQLRAAHILQGLVLWSIVGMFLPGHIAHAAHLGGLLFGIVYHELWRRTKRRKMTATFA